MGPLQTEYFRRKLIDWRQALLDESEQTLESMRDQQREVSDEAERASRETEMSFELRTRDRYRKLIRKINEALDRIEDGSYGFCEETTLPSHEEKWSGEPSRISWTSARFCNNVTCKQFAANPLKKGTDTQMEMNKFYCCKEVLRNNY